MSTRSGDAVRDGQDAGGVAVAHGTRAQATKMGMSTLTPTEVDVMFQAVPRESYP